jgi:transcription initiation factor TFIIIB Brf1 subunit/transcription initiation factor TFIIB
MRCEKCGNKEVEFDFSIGTIVCRFCGHLIEENLANSEINFHPERFNRSKIKGHLMKNMSNEKKTREREICDTMYSIIKRKINQLGNSLKLQTYHNESAFKLFVFANQKGIVNNRKLNIITISCLYTICRKEKTPHLLIDFSDITQTRSNKIGIEFLKFTKLLNFSLPITDPSLFIHRFATKMRLGSKKNSVAMSALRLLARMKRDWINTGRRPTGLCGAALMIASKMHGFKKSHKEISKLVRIGSVSLKNRLREIDNTSISILTKKELDIGGGDNGNKDSLTDYNFNRKFMPPSKQMKSNQNKYFYELKKNKSRIKFKNRTKKKPTPMAKNRAGNREIKQDDKKKIDNYLNDHFEVSVKNHIWSELNSEYFFSQSITSRSQKERPFFYSNINK